MTDAGFYYYLDVDTRSGWRRRSERAARRPSAFVRRIEQHTGSRKTTIDIEYVASDVTSIRRCEECNCGRDVGRLRIPF